jgi:Iap family predicted aminopeptidase
VAHRLDRPQLEPQVPQFRLVGEDVVFQVADFFFQVQDARRGGFGAVYEEGVEMLDLRVSSRLWCG